MNQGKRKIVFRILVLKKLGLLDYLPFSKFVYTAPQHESLELLPGSDS